MKEFVKASEGKTLVDLGFILECLDPPNFYTPPFLDKERRFRWNDNLSIILSYEDLAEDLYYFGEFSVNNQHVVGIKINYSNRGIPRSINLLTKLKILIIDNEGPRGVKLPFDTIPEEITQLTSLRILFIANSEMEEFPKEFAQFSGLRYLTIVNSTLKIVPNFIKMFPKLRQLHLETGFMEKTPDWLFEFAREHHAKKFIKKGVNKEDAAVLGLLEILSAKLWEAKFTPVDYIYWENMYDENYNYYDINEFGRVTDLKLGYWNRHSFRVLHYFPEEICKLHHLENLYICTGTYSKFWNHMGEEVWGINPEGKGKVTAWIPESIRGLKSLRRLWSNAKYSASLKPFLESLEKFETDVYEG